MKTYKLLVKEEGELKEIDKIVANDVEKQNTHLIFYDNKGNIVYTFDNKLGREIIINCE